MLPDAGLIVLPLERLTRLYDGLEQLEDMWGDDASQNEGSYYDEQEEILNELGLWEPADVEDDDWVDDEGDGMDVDDEGWASSDPTAMQLSTPPQQSAATLPDDQTMSEPHTLRPTSPDVPKHATEPDESNKVAETAENPHWKRFDVLSAAPSDHAFYTSAPAQPSRSFLARLTKEYRVLSTSLPGTCR